MNFAHRYESGTPGLWGASLGPYLTYLALVFGVGGSNARLVRDFLSRRGFLRVPFAPDGEGTDHHEEADVLGEADSKYSGVLALADGTCVPVREVRPEDAPALQRLVGRLSERSVQLRYFGPMKQLSDAQARRFAEVDGNDRYALVALDPEDGAEIVAVVRYDRGEDGGADAEYAALVEDRLQGRGLGLSLTRHLIEAARERGVERFDAFVLPENTPMLKLLRSLDLPERIRWQEGVERVEISLSPEA